MAKLKVDVEINIPLMEAGAERRLQTLIRRKAVAPLRKAVATPNRKKLPKRTGELRKSFRVGRPQRSRKGKGAIVAKRRFTIATLKYAFWLHFQKEWPILRDRRLAEQATPIIVDAVEDAMVEMGVRRRGA